MLFLLSLLACRSPELADPPPILAGLPVVGAAQGTLDLPIGTPMAGYSTRCEYLGGNGKKDSRQSPYTVGFVPSLGVHTRPRIKVIWLANGDQDLVLTQTDTIYSFDGLVSSITDALELRTGRNLRGRVTHSASHSHASYGPYSQQLHFYLGGDRYNEEIYRRMVAMVVDVAMAAYGQRQPAAIGASWSRDWDPLDEIYLDRRRENDALHFFPELPAGGSGKDPYLHLLRFDALDGDPIALMFTFGIHGTVLDEDLPMISTDAPGAVADAVEDSFDTPVVAMHLQGAGGDASPGGVGEGMARLEALGAVAAARIHDIWSATPTSSEPIRLETASRHIWQHPSQLEVHRDDRVLSYPPFVRGRFPDNVIFDADGQLATPIDEFNTEHGAAFCGSGQPWFPGSDLGASVFPYASCTDVATIARILLAIFDLEEADIAQIPFREMMKAGTTVTRVGPVPTRYPDGHESNDDFFAGFFPAEPTAMYAEQWRRRAKAEAGEAMSPGTIPLMVGYSQDHEGYFLLPEDWVLGGYEPNIALWGPLQGEHVMEQVIDYSAELLSTTDLAEDADPFGYYAPSDYPNLDLPTEFVPDRTPNAGARLTAAPSYFWTPIPMDLRVKTEVPRVQGVVQIAWEGGDPMVDLPRVLLEHQVEGEWQAVKLRNGRAVDDALGDILTAWTPEPLYPATGDQAHRWWAAWQAVGHSAARTGIPEGTYRLTVHGRRYVGAEAHWPWTTQDYSFSSEPFSVVPGEIMLQRAEFGLWASLEGSATTWRLVDPDGSPHAANPVRGVVEAIVTRSGMEQSAVSMTGDLMNNGRIHLPIDLSGAEHVRVVDAFGNEGMLDLR